MTAAQEQLEPPERRPGGAQIIPRPPSWTSGDLAAPASHPLRVTVDDIERAVTGVVPSRAIAPTFPDARASAVLVALACVVACVRAVSQAHRGGVDLRQRVGRAGLQLADVDAGDR